MFNLLYFRRFTLTGYFVAAAGIEPATPPSWVVASFLSAGDCGIRTRACHRHGIPYIVILRTVATSVLSPIRVLGSCSSFKYSWQNHLNTLPSALHYYLSFFGSQRCHRCQSFAHPVSLQDSELPLFSVAVLTALFHAVSFHAHLPWVYFDAVSACSPVSQFAITCRDCLCTSLGVVEGEGFEPLLIRGIFGDHR